MRTRHLALLALAPAAASAQVIKATTVRPGSSTFEIIRGDQPKSVIGVTTSTSGSPRDTLGLLVVSVVRGSPAEKAGIEEGNRIEKINGVNLRLAAADLGDRDMEDIMARRLNRELDKVNPGTDVDLQVYASGQHRTLKLKTVQPDVLYPSREPARPVLSRTIADRASLGVSIGINGSKKDTLGVFVIGVDEGGPAAKAGIDEGQRIAAVNGVDLRVPREDAGDAQIASARLRRLQREIENLKAGDEIELRVVSGSQTRTVKVTAVKASDLPSRNHGVTIFGGGAVAPVIIREPMAKIEIDGDQIAERIRQSLDHAMTITGDRLDDVRDRLRDFRFEDGRTVRW